MITNKRVNRIIMVVVVMALLFTVIFTYSPDKLKIQGSSNKESMSYENMLFAEDRVMTIDIQMDEREFDQMLLNALDEIYYRCNITINGTTFYNVGIRPKGNSSLFMIALDDSTNRFSFKLEFDHFQDGQTCYGLDKLALNNVMGDSTYMKEYLSYDMMSDMGVAAPMKAFADIKLNGNDWGLYFAVEGMEDSFARRNYGIDHGKLYKPESSMFEKLTAIFKKDDDTMKEMFNNREMMQNMEQMDFDFENFDEMMGGGTGFFGKSTNLTYIDDKISSYEEIFNNEVFDGTKSDYRRLINSLEKLNNGEDLENVVDVEQTLKYFAVNNTVVSMDSYVGATMHNYYLYEKDGKLTILPWDYNYSFGAFGCTTGGDMVNFPIDSPVQGGTLEERPLLGKLLEHEEYVNLYHSYYEEILERYFYNGKYETTIRRLEQLIDPYVKNDKTSFFTYDEFKSGAGNLIELGRLRADSISGQLNGSVPSTKEGQKTNPERLILADSVDYNALGNSTDLAKNFGNTDETAKNTGDDSTSLHAETDNSQKNLGGDKESIEVMSDAENSATEQMERGAMMMSLMAEPDTSSSGVKVIVTSFFAMILGIFFVRYYNR